MPHIACAFCLVEVQNNCASIRKPLFVERTVSREGEEQAPNLIRLVVRNRHRINIPSYIYALNQQQFV
jgi:hypothetical protein